MLKLCYVEPDIEMGIEFIMPVFKREDPRKYCPPCSVQIDMEVAGSLGWRQVRPQYSCYLFFCLPSAATKQIKEYFLGPVVSPLRLVNRSRITQSLSFPFLIIHGAVYNRIRHDATTPPLNAKEGVMGTAVMIYKPYCSFTRCAMPICSSRLMGVSMEM